MQLTVRDAARILNVSEKTLYRWIGEGNIPAYRVNEQYRFNRDELLEWANAKKIVISTQIFKKPDSDETPLPAVSEALDRGGIFHRVGGTDRESVLRAIVKTMQLPEEVDREFLFQVFLARETMGSTAIGEGIAMPHVRNPVVLHVNQPMITLCFLDKPVEFSAVDGKPVHTLFSLVSPTVRAHLHLLSRLAFALRDAAFKAAILRQAPREEILKEAKRFEAGAGQPPAAPPRE